MQPLPTTIELIGSYPINVISFGFETSNDKNLLYIG